MEPAWPHLQSQVEAAQHVSADAMQAWYPHCMSMDLMTVYRFVRRYQDHADRHPVVCSRDSLCERLGCRDKNRQACKGGMRKVQLRLEGADRCYSETAAQPCPPGAARCAVRGELAAEQAEGLTRARLVAVSSVH